MKKLILLLSIILSSFLVKAQVIPVTDSVQISLAGSTDPDGTITAYFLTQTSGTSVTIKNGSTSSPLLIFSTAGTYVFTASVTDNDGAMSLATITTTVFASNVAPIVKITINGVDYTNKVYQIKLH